MLHYQVHSDVIIYTVMSTSIADAPLPGSDIIIYTVTRVADGPVCMAKVYDHLL